MRNGSAGCCPPRFVAFSHLPTSTTSTSARTLTSPSKATSRYRLVKGGNRRGRWAKRLGRRQSGMRPRLRKTAGRMRWRPERSHLLRGGRVPGSSARNMELDREMRREQGEVSVRGQNGHAVAVGDCANHEVGVRPLDSPRAARVEKLGGALMIGRPDRQVRELAEVGAETVELRLLSNPREHLLADGADDMSAALADELPELQHLGVL